MFVGVFRKTTIQGGSMKFSSSAKRFAVAATAGLSLAAAATAIAQDGGTPYYAPNAKVYAYEGPNVQPNGEPYYANGNRGWDVNASSYYGGGRFTICSRFDRYLERPGTITYRQYECGTGVTP